MLLTIGYRPSLISLSCIVDKRSIMAKFSPVKHNGMVLNTVHKSDKKTGKSAYFGKKLYKTRPIML